MITHTADSNLSDTFAYFCREAYGDVRKICELPGFEDVKGYYYAFPDGRIYSTYLCGFLSPSSTPSGGHLQVSLQTTDGGSRTCYIHQIQAAAKHGYGKPDGWHVRHINGDEKDNSRANVEYCLPAVNHADATKHGKRGKRLSKREVQKARLFATYRSKRHGKGFSNRLIAEFLDTLPGTISNIINRKSRVEVGDLFLGDYEGMVWSFDSDEPEFWSPDR